MQAAWSEPLNAGSPHRGGARASALLEGGRAAVADLIHALPGEVVFTSGATESNNLAIRGVAGWAMQGGSHRRQIIVSAVEHKAVLAAARSLTDDGFEVVEAPVTRQGVIDLAQLSSLMSNRTLLVSVMHINNETGVIQPVRAACALTHAVGGLFHSDAAQSVGKIGVDVLDLGIDYLSISSHKMYGPAGVGALYVAAATPRPSPLIHGGGQERGLRSGTVPVPLVVGFGEAARVAADRHAIDAERLVRQETLLIDALRKSGLVFRITSGDAGRLPGAMSIQIDERRADDIVDRLSRHVSLSTGSACSSGQVQPSHVLHAMGFSNEKSFTTLRIYINRYNTDLEIETAAGLFADIATAP